MCKLHYVLVNLLYSLSTCLYSRSSNAQLFSHLCVEPEEGKGERAVAASTDSKSDVDLASIMVSYYYVPDGPVQIAQLPLL